MDGNTTIITRAADIAASKGILVVASAGNEGNKSWQKIICPADGDSVIAAGAVNALGYYASFSSKGPSSDGRIKPDLSGQGSGVVAAHPGGGMTLANGTSLSAPLISGLAAGIWQAYPELSNMDLFYYMRRSASKYYKPDNFTGYGIPNYRMVKMLIEDGVFEKASVFPNPGDGSYYVINLPLWENEKEVKLQIYDLRGRLVFSDHFTASLRIELNNVLTHSPAGLYFIRISGETREYVLKIIKE
jgi:subtilisin family serine protease